MVKSTSHSVGTYSHPQYAIFSECGKNGALAAKVAHQKMRCAATYLCAKFGVAVTNRTKVMTKKPFVTSFICSKNNYHACFSEPVKQSLKAKAHRHLLRAKHTKLIASTISAMENVGLG